jgi:hypothetical protein
VRRSFSVVYPGRRLSGNRTGVELRETNRSSPSSIREPVGPWREFQLLRVVVHVAGVGPLLDLTDCGDIVVDPFLGSGSTLSAADKTGRVCRGVELDPLYVDVIVRRFKAATGNQAVLVETGETFEALATQGAGTGVGLRPAPAVADVADEPPRNGRLLPVKRAGTCTAEVRGSNPLSSTRKSTQIDMVS